MREEYGYTPKSIYAPTRDEWEAELERAEHRECMDILFEFLDCHHYSDNPEVMEHLKNAKQAYLDRDPHHLGNCIIAACRMAGFSTALEKTNEWADKQTELTKAEHDNNTKFTQFAGTL